MNKRQLIQIMSWNRAQFIDKLIEPLTGAIGEYYKYRVAIKNGQHKWTQHWLSEVRSLLERQLLMNVRHEIRGFRDRRKAVRKAVMEVQAMDHAHRTFAANTVMKDYKLRGIRKLVDGEDTRMFWAWAEEAIERALDSVNKPLVDVPEHMAKSKARSR